MKRGSAIAAMSAAGSATAAAMATPANTFACVGVRPAMLCGQFFFLNVRAQKQTGPWCPLLQRYPE